MCVGSPTAGTSFNSPSRPDTEFETDRSNSNPSALDLKNPEAKDLNLWHDALAWRLTRMKTVSAFLVFALAAGPVFAQEPAPPAQSGANHRAMFWSGLALGIAGVTTSVIGATFARVDDSSSGNSPIGTYQACVAQKSNPIYATNDCNALKGKNLPVLWSGVAIGALGGVMLIGSARTSVQISPGAIKVFHVIRF